MLKNIEYYYTNLLHYFNKIQNYLVLSKIFFHCKYIMSQYYLSITFYKLIQLENWLSEINIFKKFKI